MSRKKKGRRRPRRSDRSRRNQQREPSPAHEKPRSATICRDCQATNDPGASECWLCSRRDWRDPNPAAIKPHAETTSDARLTTYVETILIGLALAIVGAGAVRLAPGLGIAFLILLVPAWAITEKRSRSRKAPMSAHRKFANIVGTAILIPFGLALCLPIFLICICAAAIGVVP
jgi:ribosomal protein L40E